MQQVFIPHSYADYFGRSEGKGRESLVFICKYHVKTQVSSEQLPVPLMKGRFSFCPLIALFCSGISGHEEEPPELVVRAHNAHSGPFV